MNKKIRSIVFYIISAVSLAIGASFHGYRMHPEDIAKYNIGVTMGIVMIFIFVVSLIVGIVLTILARKEGKKPDVFIEYDPEKQRAVLKCSICNGEKVAGFRDKQTGHFTEAMLIRDDQDLKHFMEMYGLSSVSKEY